MSYDARLKQIFLTSEALELQEKASAAFHELERQLTKEISEEEFTVFFDVIEKMKQNIES